MEYQDRLKTMLENNMTIGDTMAIDNIFTEYTKGVSIDDLATKYDTPSEKIKLYLRKLGVEIED